MFLRYLFGIKSQELVAEHMPQLDLLSIGNFLSSVHLKLIVVVFNLFSQHFQVQLDLFFNVF